MKVGDLVGFNNNPKSTHGARALELRYPSRTGVVLGDRYFKRDGAMSKDDIWCEVLWPDNAITPCYKNDLLIGIFIFPCSVDHYVIGENCTQAEELRI